MSRNNCERNFCGNYFCDFTTLITKMFCKMKKRLLITKKRYDFERKHTKMWYNWQNLFYKTYILEHLIAKTRSTKIYFAVNFFFKVTHVVFLYTVYIFLYKIYIWYNIYILYIYIYIIYLYIAKKTQSQYLVLMGLQHNRNTWCWWILLPKFYSVIITVFQNFIKS